MRHAIILILVFLVTLTVVLIIYRPDVVEKTWLWVIGLSGTIIGLAREAMRRIQKYVNSLRNK